MVKEGGAAAVSVKGTWRLFDPSLSRGRIIASSIVGTVVAVAIMVALLRLLGLTSVSAGPPDDQAFGEAFRRDMEWAFLVIIDALLALVMGVPLAILCSGGTGALMSSRQRWRHAVRASTLTGISFVGVWTLTALVGLLYWLVDAGVR